LSTTSSHTVAANHITHDFVTMTYQSLTTPASFDVKHSGA